MAISLIGLSWFQLYWISNVIELSKQRFEKDALASLDKVALRLERNEMAVVATNSFAFFEASDKHFDKSVEVYDINLLEEIDSAENTMWFKSNTKGHIKIIVRTDSSQELHEFVNDTSFSIAEIQVMANIEGDSGIAKLTLDRINRKRKVFTRVVEEMMFHEVRETQRVHPAIIDSLLREEFNSHGIYLSFEFGIYDGQEKEFRIVKANNEELLKSSTLTASLFPNDIIGNTLSLMVSFPDKNQYLIRKIWLSLFTSIFFILMIIAIFSYVVYKVVHQKKLSDLKNDFINNMTHEFKTPIATVSLASEALQEESVYSSRETMLRYVGVIQQESKRLGIQVEKVLQLASMDKESISFDKKEVIMNSIITVAVDRAIFQIEEKRGELKVQLLDSNLEIVADETHLANAIFNLLDNAIKYSAGPPKIELSAIADNDRIIINIKDNGIGLSKNQQEDIFEKFYRVPTGNLHDVKGFGLGLNYVKYVIEGHKGKINVSSKLGKGSTFSLELPINS